MVHSLLAHLTIVICLYPGNLQLGTRGCRSIPINCSCENLRKNLLYIFCHWHGGITFRSGMATRVSDAKNIFIRVAKFFFISSFLAIGRNPEAIVVTCLFLFVGLSVRHTFGY